MNIIREIECIDNYCFVYLSERIHNCVKFQCRINFNLNSEKNNSNEEIKLMHLKVYINKRKLFAWGFSMIYISILDTLLQNTEYIYWWKKLLKCFYCEMKDLNWKILQQTNLLYVFVTCVLKHSILKSYMLRCFVYNLQAYWFFSLFTYFACSVNAIRYS